MSVVRPVVALSLSLILSACLASGHETKADQPLATHGWKYEIYISDLSRADNIAIGKNGEFYVSLENSKGVGQVIRLINGHREIIANGLNRPDGLALSGSQLYITEEVPGGRLIRVDLTDLSQTVVALLEKPEGIDLAPDGSLIIAEDIMAGRLIRMIDKDAFDVVESGLIRPEGISIAPDGRIYVAETSTGRVFELSSGASRVLVEGLKEPDQVAVNKDGAIWITEDQEPGRLLRYYNDQLEVVIEGLMSPQGIAFDAQGNIYVSEQGRDRIILIRRDVE